MDQKIEKIAQELAALKREVGKICSFDEMRVFGSVAKNESRSSSDIDVAIVSPFFKKNAWDKRIKLSLVAHKIDDRFEVHVFSPEDFADPYHPLVAEVKKYGVVV